MTRELREDPHVAKCAYRWERERWPDLRFSVDYPLAWNFMKLLMNHYRVRVGFFYCPSDPGNRLSGACDFEKFGKIRIARVILYEPFYLGTVGHEFTHALRYVRHEKRGHGDTWRDDLKEVQDRVRAWVPEWVCAQPLPKPEPAREEKP